MFVKFSGSLFSPDHTFDIVDTDFIAYTIPNTWEDFFRIYENRGLNVAANMAIAFKHVVETFNVDMMEVIEKNVEFNPLYPKYADEINKYLMLT